MMPAGNLARMVMYNTVRNPRHFILSVFGIVIGIWAFAIFLALTIGVSDVLLGKVFPINEVEVRAPHASLLGKDVSKKLDDSVVDAIKARPEIADAVPRMNAIFPALGFGTFGGEDLNFEVGGFADGIPPSVIEAQAKQEPNSSNQKMAELFQDWDPVDVKANKTCEPPPYGKRSLTANPCDDKDHLMYCDAHDKICRHRVPVVVSPTLIEIYNSQFAPAHNLPQIGELETFIVQRGGFGAMSFEIHLGDTLVAGSNAKIPTDKKHIVEAVVVGISPKAMATGMTMPLAYMRRWVSDYVGPDAAKQYSRIIVTLADKDRLAVFNQWIEDNSLRIEDSNAERFATTIFIIQLILFAISFLIIVISAINIAHNLFMQISERKREIGVLRAVGATRLDVRMLILGEAAVIGLIGGILGILTAEVTAHVADILLTKYLPRFPFKPDTYFDFKLWIMATGMAFSTVFCVLGGFLPARKASLIEPAQALAAQ